MNRRFLCALALFLVCTGGIATTPDEIPGLRYEHRKLEGPQSVHILEVDPRRLRIEAVRALDDGVGRETVASIAERKGAIAAVNAGFFRIGGRYDGEPTGILKIREQWFSDPDEPPRGAIGWTANGGLARIARVGMKWQVQNGGTVFPVDGINRPRGAAEAILYDWAFHRTTLTDPGGTEFVISRGRIVSVTHDGNAAIPVDGFVYSLGPKSSIKTEGLAKRSRVAIHYSLRPASVGADESANWRKMDFIVGGVPVLFFKRALAFESNSEKARAGFAEERHPRTAVGLREDGTMVFVVVDGRQPSLSIGMSLKELSQLMLSLGCVDALNLDGGGSSTIYYQGKVVNSPSDPADRPVSDAIAIRQLR